MHFAFLFPTLYTIRDFFLVNVPLLGSPIGQFFQWIINFLPL